MIRNPYRRNKEAPFAQGCAFRFKGQLAAVRSGQQQSDAKREVTAAAAGSSSAATRRSRPNA
jgi:hypothetical protein